MFGTCYWFIHPLMISNGERRRPYIPNSDKSQVKNPTTSQIALKVDVTTEKNHVEKKKVNASNTYQQGSKNATIPVTASQQHRPGNENTTVSMNAAQQHRPGNKNTTVPMNATQQHRPGNKNTTVPMNATQQHRPGNNTNATAPIRGIQQGSPYVLDKKLGVNNTQGKNSTIFEAASKGDLNTVKYLVEKKKVNVNSYLPGSKETVLMKAAQQGSASVIQYLADHNAQVNAKDRNGYNALLWAVDSNISDANGIRTLLNKGADFRVKDKKYGYSPAHWAAYNGRVDILKLLQEKGAPMNENSLSPTGAVDEKTPLFIASERGHIPTVAYLLDNKLAFYDGDKFTAATKGHYALVVYFVDKEYATPQALQPINKVQTKNLINARNANRQTLLSTAVYNGHLKIVKYLVNDKQADLNMLYNYGASILHIAAERGQLEILMYLIDEKNMSWDVYDADYDTPLSYAVSYGHLDIVRYLVDEKQANSHAKYKYGKSLIHKATEKGRLEVVKYLIDNKNVSLDVADNNGDTPLSYAVFYNHLDIVKYLVDDKLADINLQYRKTQQWLQHTAARAGHLEILRYLIDQKHADIDVKDINKDTPLSYGVLYGQIDVVRYLVDEKQAALNGRFQNNKGLLHIAVENGHLDIVKYLAGEKNLNVEIKDEYNYTPLSYAVYFGHLDIVKYLIEVNQADVMTKDLYGNGVLQYAAEKGYLDILKYLMTMKKKLDVNMKNNSGQTSLHKATMNGHLDVVKYLVEEQKANVKEVNKNSETALQLAQQGSDEDLITYLTSKNRRRRRRQIVPSNYMPSRVEFSGSGLPSSIPWSLNKNTTIGSTQEPNTSSAYSPAVMPTQYDQKTFQSIGASGEGFLSLSDVVVRMLTSKKYKLPTNNLLLSKNNILLNETNTIDSDNIIDAIQTGYKTKYFSFEE